MYIKIKFIFLLLIVCVTVSFSPKKLTWIAIGDSITYLNEHKEETGNRIAKGYMTRVVEKLPNITYINQGHNGWTSEKIAANIEELGLEKADVYSIFLGTNDWWQGRKVGTIADYQNNKGNSSLPKFIEVPFNPETDEYPYPLEAIAITYDGLHPSDKGYDIIAGLLVKVMRKY